MGKGQTTPREQNFDVNKNLLSPVICYKFKTKLFEVWIYTHSFMILYMYIAPRQGT